MKRFFGMISIALGITFMFAQAEVTTVITTTTTPDGNEEVLNIEYVDTGAPKGDVYDEFNVADKNNDGCIDRKEAHTSGILNFNKYAKTNSNCLTPDEYRRAMEGEEPNQ